MQVYQYSDYIHNVLKQLGFRSIDMIDQTLCNLARQMAN